MLRIQRSDLNTDASGDDMVSLRQKDPPSSSSSSSSSNNNTNINRNSSGRGFIIYQIIFLVTAMDLAVLWGSKFVAHKHEHQQLRNKQNAILDDNIIDELGSLEQELADREKAVKTNEQDLAKRGKEEQLAKREKEAAASAASAASAAAASAASASAASASAASASKSSASSTNTGNSLEDTAWERMNSIKRAQVENYRSEQALMLNIHATHHGGVEIG